jgi:uncharacterized membrane protein YkoI
MKKKHAAGYLVALSCIALAIAFMILPNGSIVLAQQQNSTTTGGTMTMMPSGQQTSKNSYSMRSSSANWTGSISLFSPIIDTFKSKIHTTLNDATTNALKAVGGGSNSSAIAAFIHPERGFLVYQVCVLDSNDNIHRVIVDPGDGKVLSNQPMSMMDMMTMMHPSMGMGMMGPGMGMMMGPRMMMQHGMMGPGMGMMSSPNNAWP